MTASRVADALVLYAQHIASHHSSASVVIPVLEANGSVSEHTLLLGPGTALDVVDVDGFAVIEDEFLVPEFPAIPPRASSLTLADVPDLEWGQTYHRTV